MRGLAGKKVLVTGAASGIGRATAARFYEEGARLILNDVVPLERTELQTAFPERMTYVQADVSKPEGFASLESAARAEGLDVLVNNAGITRDKSLAKLAIEDWDQVIAVNLTAVFRLSQMAAAIMKEKKSGVILNAASVVAHYGNFGQANYVATKAGVIGLTKTLARELGRSGIRVNAVAPGFVLTEMVRKVPQENLDQIAGSTPLKRLGQPEEIASVYAFLASDDASYITGAVIDVNGGLVLGT
ncbi:3-oxoacyl-ACP reductase FabG [Polyangium aurulentum]|uniref:3-oxoacyl-ACP reductase FabG n=1 Tax=Polyangium aurulentum TaxID=2567896 RepID=UPI0010ADF280|nr:3-oxoacyl-ACP reductase FabG [Polyangium aurulentum]UQA56740.1 3-oxoacyl-ACP reductase FabG [Polyangium aurulentum]